MVLLFYNFILYIYSSFHLNVLVCVSVGSLGKWKDETDLRGVTITNCTLTNTTNGARIKSYRQSPSLSASGIVFDNLVMNGVFNPIIIDQNYDSSHLKQVIKLISKIARGPKNYRAVLNHV